MEEMRGLTPPDSEGKVTLHNKPNNCTCGQLQLKQRSYSILLKTDKGRTMSDLRHEREYLVFDKGYKCKIYSPSRLSLEEDVDFRIMQNAVMV